MPGDSLPAHNKYFVTAIVSTYNSSSLLIGCLDDLIGQTLYENNQLEVIVIDSGSLENESVIVANYQRRYQHIRYLRTERETVYGAWNRGIQIAQGKYVTNANTDDAHRQNALELLVAALNKYPEADLAYSHCAFTNRPNDKFPTSNAYLECLLPPFNPALGMFYCLLGPHPLWRKTVFSKIGMFDPSFVGAGDYDFQMRFIKAGLNAVLVPEILSLFYQNPRGLSLSSNRTIEESKEIEQKYRASIPIDCLYSVSIPDIQSIADAWVAQGNMALTWKCAWEKNPPKDYHYAFQCYTKALEVMPDYSPAVKNLIFCLAEEGKWDACEYVATKYRQDMKAVLSSFLINNPPLLTPSVTPRISTQLFIPSDSLSTDYSEEPFPNPLSLSSARNNLGRAFVIIKHAISAVKAGDMENAFQNLRNSAKLVGDDAETIHAIAILLMGIGRFDAAKEILETVCSLGINSEKIEHLLDFAILSAQDVTPYIIPQVWMDIALNSIADLEFKALNLPADIAPLLLAGAKEEEHRNLQATLHNYRDALAKAEKPTFFKQSLLDKITFLQSHLSLSDVKDLSPVFLRTEQPSSKHRISRLCSQDDFEIESYKQLCRELDISPDHYERKNWEYYFVAQALISEGLLIPGRMGLGFGVGKEKLISYFAKYGCSVLATDLEPDNEVKKAWVDTNQHSDSVKDFFLPGICDYETFTRQVQFSYVDMNRIPVELQREEFDFTWSCCAFEHVGSIEHGKQFILNQMKCLKPGGIALHTTEFNLSSDVLTVESGPTVIFRKCDIEEIAEALRKEGHEIMLDYDVGCGELDRYVDIPPYMTAPDKRHLRLLLWKYITTSIGLFIRKKS